MGDGNTTSPPVVYDAAHPDGYQLGQELGNDSGQINAPPGVLYVRSHDSGRFRTGRRPQRPKRDPAAPVHRVTAYPNAGDCPSPTVSTPGGRGGQPQFALETVQIWDSPRGSETAYRPGSEIGDSPLAAGGFRTGPHSSPPALLGRCIVTCRAEREFPLSLTSRHHLAGGKLREGGAPGVAGRQQAAGKMGLAPAASRHPPSKEAIARYLSQFLHVGQRRRD